MALSSGLWRLFQTTAMLLAFREQWGGACFPHRLRQGSLNLCLLGNKGKTPNVPDKKKAAKSDTRSGKARQFYHIEYFFLPDDIEPKIVDVVVFPNIAKVFLESGIKVSAVCVCVCMECHTQDAECVPLTCRKLSSGVF